MEKTFVRITNTDIYKKLISIEEHVIRTNGKVKLNRWIASTCLGLILLVFGVFMDHLASG